MISLLHKTQHWISRFGCLALLMGGLLVPVSIVQAQNPKVVLVGATKSLFRDVSDTKIKELTGPFDELMLKHTGLKGKVAISPDALELADLLENEKMDLGLFQGYEFAWAQKKFPKLKPLMIAINKQPYMAVHLVTPAKSKITNLADLKGKKISLPFQSRGHNYWFIEHYVEKEGTTSEKFFGKILKPENVETALDDVARGDVDAAIVDTLSLDSYAIVKPGVMPLLKTAEKTDLFPPAVIVYREGALTPQTLDIFRKGMLSANKDAKSRGVMALWKVTGFEPVPTDFQMVLDTIRKAYPAPKGW